MDEFGRTYRAMIESLRKNGWKFVAIPGIPSVFFTVEARYSSLVCYCDADEESGQVVFHTKYGVKAPAHRRGEADEYLRQVNAQVTVGSFDLDVDTGTARFCAISSGCPITPGEMLSLVLPSVEAADNYLPGFLAVCAGTLSPDEVIKLTEVWPVAEFFAEANETVDETLDE